VGEQPQAVEAQGLSVHGLRLGAVVAGSGLMAMGGAFLTLSAFNSFFFEMVNGRGWICIALVVSAGGGRERRCSARCFSPRSTPSRFASSLSFRCALPALPDAALRPLDPRACGMSRRARVPAALMIPYNRGDR
jgi:simple sugar transport system permease protein